MSTTVSKHALERFRERVDDSATASDILKVFAQAHKFTIEDRLKHRDFLKMVNHEFDGSDVYEAGIIVFIVKENNIVTIILNNSIESNRLRARQLNLSDEPPENNPFIPSENAIEVPYSRVAQPDDWQQWNRCGRYMTIKDCAHLLKLQKKGGELKLNYNGGKHSVKIVEKPANSGQDTFFISFIDRPEDAEMHVIGMLSELFSMKKPKVIKQQAQQVPPNLTLPPSICTSKKLSDKSCEKLYKLQQRGGTVEHCVSSDHLGNKNWAVIEITKKVVYDGKVLYYYLEVSKSGYKGQLTYMNSAKSTQFRIGKFPEQAESA